MEHQVSRQSQKSNQGKPLQVQNRVSNPVIHGPQSSPLAVIQRAVVDPYSLTPADVMQLQRTIGNEAAGRLLEKAALQPIQAAEEPFQMKPNNTGMPDNLKAGVERLSGFSMDDVRVHYNSDKPKGLGALAYTQGTDIHVASGQERHLAHEAWHVVQQKEGRVKPTGDIGGMPLNDNRLLETEADVMGAKALQLQTEKTPVCTAQKTNTVKQGFGFVDNRWTTNSIKNMQENIGESLQRKQAPILKTNLDKIKNNHSNRNSIPSKDKVLQPKWTILNYNITQPTIPLVNVNEFINDSTATTNFLLNPRVETRG